MGVQSVKNSCKLIVYAIDLPGAVGDNAERDAWKNEVQRLRSDTVVVDFIRLNLDAFRKQMNDEQDFEDQMRNQIDDDPHYEMEMRRLRSHIRKEPELQKHISWHPNNGSQDDQRRTRKSIDWLKKMARKGAEGNFFKRAKVFTGYMIIAEGVALSMIYDMMIRDINIRAKTVELVSRGVRASGWLSMGGWSADDGDILSKLSPGLQPLAWDVSSTSTGDQGKDLQVLTSAAFQLLVEESKVADSDFNRVMIKRRETGDSLESMKRLSQATRRLTLPVIAEQKDIKDNAEPRGINPSTEKATLGPKPSSHSLDKLDQVPYVQDQAINPEAQQTTPVLNPSSHSLGRPDRMSDIRDQAIDCFYANSLKNADRLFTACAERVDWMNQESEPTRLEIALLHGVTRLHIGRYYDAKNKLKDALDYAQSLTCDASKEKCDSYLIDIEMQLILWHATALMRVGYYDTASKQLENLFERTMIEDGELEEACHERFLEVRINAHLMHSLIENHSGNFKSIDQDKDLLSARQMLTRLASLCALKGNQSQQTPAKKPHTGDTTQGQKSIGSEEETFVPRIRHQKPAVLQNQFDLTRCHIMTIQGNFGDAYPELESVHKKLKNSLGPNNIVTLEASLLLAGLYIHVSNRSGDEKPAAGVRDRNIKHSSKGHLMAMDAVHIPVSNLSEGEELAADARDRITEHLGQDHPLAMEATHVTIAAYTFQGREEEALRVSQNLCQHCEGSDIFGVTQSDRAVHPRISAYYTQLSDAHVTIGNYKEAEKKLRTALFGENDSDENVPVLTTVRSLSHLAWAHVHLGKYETAEAKLRQALRLLLAGEIITPSSNTSSLASRRALLDDSRAILFPTEEREKLDIIRYHPDVLFTLQVCSELESRRGDADLEFVLEAREVLLKRWAKLTGKNSTNALRAQLSLGYAMNALGHARHRPALFLDAFRHFEQVLRYCGTEIHLHRDHPLTLEAKREWYLSKMRINKTRDFKIKQSTKILENVISRQRRSLGSYRTQTLQTCLCHIYAAVAIGQPATEEREHLLAKLRDPQVRAQRLVESLRMEEQLAQNYSLAQFNDICRHVLDGLLEAQKYIDETEEDPEIKASCDEIFKRAGNHLKRMEGRIKEA